MVFIDPVLPSLVLFVLIVFIVGIVMRYLKQPHVIAYILVGVLLGPHLIGLITDQNAVTRMGSIGVVLLLFFVGMEVSLDRLISNWKVAVIGTFFQILISLGVTGLIGYWFNWPLGRSILLGFVISLSSTAVVLKILESLKELNTKTGQDVLGILLVQDLAVIPMFIVISLLGGNSVSMKETSFQIIGGILIVCFMIWLIRKKEIRLHLDKLLGNDHEMQLFMALVICLGAALLTGMLGLSTALGAFIAGIVVAAAKETRWVHKSLDPFRIIFVALFFVSVGILIDINFLSMNIKVIALLVAGAFLTNWLINGVILKVLGSNWRESLYSGAMLSQIGEFSFILAAIGLQSNLINDFSYQTTIAVISLTLLLSPPWIYLVKKLTVKK